ncbi:52K [Bearded dragon adenovirus 1]|uniref:52K n=1 Tax=Bearded dragon adenovirus 1 TaxID=2729647 RepID=A0A6N3IR65_9ADEN|nr:52K [Bearded dragon adenovirus 1]QJR83090.1 52K [Bearded dragon adenovirus 1]
MQKHPLLKNLRRSPEGQAEAEDPEEPVAAGTSSSSCGIAAPRSAVEARVRFREDGKAPKARLPQVDLFRDPEPYMEEERDLRYRASGCLNLPPEVMTEVDFQPDEVGNRAIRQLEAAKLKRSGEFTRDAEKWQHDLFQSSVRQLLLRHNTPMGMLYLSDFFNTFVDAPPSHALSMQHLTILNHVTEPTLYRALKEIDAKTKGGRLKKEWLLHLLEVLHMIFKEERTVSGRLTALMTACNEIALAFAKKACGGRYPSTDKFSKTLTYFRRLVVAILALAESIGCYAVNYAPPRAPKKAKLEVEPSDSSYMLRLEGALEAPESDEEWNEREDEGESGEEEEWQ